MSITLGHWANVIYIYIYIYININIYIYNIYIQITFLLQFESQLEIFMCSFLSCYKLTSALSVGSTSDFVVMNFTWINLL